MLKTYELPEEELIREIQDNNRITDTIYLIHKFIKSDSLIARNKLSEIALINYELVTETINDYLQIVKDHNIEHLLTVDFSYFFNDVDFKDHEQIKNTKEFKLFDKYVFPLSLRVEDLHFSLILQQLLKYKDLQKVTQYDLLIKSLNASMKYLNFIKVKFNLSDRTITYFTYGLLQRVCTVVFEIFNREEFISYTETIKEMTFKLSELNNKFFNELNNEQIKDKIKREIDQFRIENEHIVTSYTNNIVGVNELIKIKELNLDKFYFEDFKNIIKLRFSPNDKVSYGKSLELSLWIMYLKANKDSDTLPFEDKFILNKMIIPFGDDLKELLGVDFDYSNFNIEEAINYINRLRTEGEYKNKHYKTNALKKVFNLVSDKEELSITEYKYRDKLTSDYSDRMNCILKVLKKHGTKDNPSFEEKNGFTVYKNGNALDDSDIELFYYLIGELEEHNCEQVITFRRSDLINNMGYNSLRGHKLDNLTSSLMNLNAQAIAIIDNRDDKVGKKLGKANFKKFKGTQLLRADIIGEGDEVLIKFTSPFSKYFREQKQFGRLLNREIINKYLFTNPRVVKIARELSRMLYISNQRSKKAMPTIEINYDTLIKNIGEEERYNTHSNKRVYLSRLSNDIEKAINSIEGNIKHELIKPTPKTIKNGKIKLLKK